ncbi:MAG TPA: GNAT family N-acetyltransferase [Terracidiphilus sp.]
MPIHIEQATALEPATTADIPALVELRTAVNERLQMDFGLGFWCSRSTAKGAAFQLRRGGVYVARRRGRLIATLTISKRKPWAIDRSYFSASNLPLYITGMAIDPQHQRKGWGRKCIEEARRIAHAQWADAICLDAYDCAAGAGPFYAKCGFREVGRVVYRVAPLIYYEMVL